MRRERLSHNGEYGACDRHDVGKTMETRLMLRLLKIEKRRAKKMLANMTKYILREDKKRLFKVLERYYIPNVSNLN